MTPHLTIIIVATVGSHLRCFHLPWVKHLQSRGFKVIGAASDIATCPQRCSVFDEVATVPFSRSILSWQQICRAGSVLSELCDRVEPLLVHFHTPNAAFWGRLALAGRKNKPKIAYTCHGFHFQGGGNVLKNRVYKTAESWMAHHTDALITINPEDFKAASEFQLAPGGFVEQISGIGLDLNRFNPDQFSVLQLRDRLRKELNVACSSPMVLMVAEFIPRKRHQDLLAAVKRCKNKDFHLLFAGNGKGLETVKQQAFQLGLHKRVHFLGFRNDIPEILAGVDVVVLPSEQEGLPACVMEALAMGKPVIGANVRGTRDLLGSDCGWLHEVGDVGSLARQIDHVLTNSMEALQRAANGRGKILTQYGWPQVREQLVKIYRRLGVNL